MFPESHGFIAMLVTNCIKDTCSNLSLSISDGRNCFELVTGIATKPSINMSLNINTCKNEYTIFSENLRVVAIKLLMLTKFESTNQSIYFVNLTHCDVDTFLN